MKIKDVIENLQLLQEIGYTELYIATDEELNNVYTDIFYQEFTIKDEKAIVMCPIGKEIEYQ